MKKQSVLSQAYHQLRQIRNVFSTLPADIGVLKIKAIMFVMLPLMRIDLKFAKSPALA